MATWKGRFSTKYSEYMGMDYADTEVSWTYGTVSDILTLHYKQGPYNDYYKHHESQEFTEHMSQEKAMALLEQLIDWAECYQREGIVLKLLEKREKR